MKQKIFSTKVLAEIAIFAALGLVLDALSSGIFRSVWVNGGSICIAMVCVFIISYRRGLLPGLLCGFILSIVQMFSGIYVINGVTYTGPMRVLAPFFQVILDYVLGYTLCGLAGVFAKQYKNTDSKKSKLIYIIIGTVVAGLLKYICHVLAGGFFWLGDGSGSFWGVSNATWLYSFVYNGSYSIPNIILCTSIMALISLKYDFFLCPKEGVGEKPREVRTVKNIVIKSVLAIASLGMIIFATVKLVNSVYTYENDDMVHTTISLNNNVVVDNFTKNSYEIDLKAGDKLVFDLSDNADGYTCIKKIQIKDTDNIILFGWDGNYTEDARLELTPDLYEDWGADYTALYGPITYTADSDQTIIMTPYLGGSGIDLNYDYVIGILAALVILFYAIHTLILESMATFKTAAISFGLANAIIVTYAFGVFFKALNKAISKGKEFDFNAYSKYLIASISIIVVYTLVFVISYIIKKKLFKNNIINQEQNISNIENEQQLNIKTGSLD